MEPELEPIVEDIRQLIEDEKLTKLDINPFQFWTSKEQFEKFLDSLYKNKPQSKTKP